MGGRRVALFTHEEGGNIGAHHGYHTSALGVSVELNLIECTPLCQTCRRIHYTGLLASAAGGGGEERAMMLYQFRMHQVACEDEKFSH